MSNNFVFELTDTVTHEMGLYHGTLKGTRAERADIFEKLLRDKILGISFFLKSDPTRTRLAVCTRNSCWIKYDPDEEARSDQRAEKIAAGVKVGAPAHKKPTIYQNGVIPVYDVLKGNWISFDVDTVESVRGVISYEMDMLWLARKEYGRLGLLRNPDNKTIRPTTISPVLPGGANVSVGAGGGGSGISITGPNPSGVTITSIGGGGGGGGGAGLTYGGTAKQVAPGPWQTVSGTSITEMDISKAKDLLNLPQDADVPTPVTQILTDYFDAVRQMYDVNDLPVLKKAMMDKVHALYNKNKVP